jgi:ABC-type amino acid transport substrate-binding protein
VSTRKEVVMQRLPSRLLAAIVMLSVLAVVPPRAFASLNRLQPSSEARLAHPGVLTVGTSLGYPPFSFKQAGVLRGRMSTWLR